MRLLALFLSLLIALPCWAPPMTMNVPYEQWREKTVLTLMVFLHENRRNSIRVKLADGTFKFFLVSKSLLGQIADCAYMAAELNPHWGNCQEEVAGKLICVSWVESGFDAACINMNNRFGTVDVGWMQVNSCNWQDSGGGCAWETFCSKQKLNPKNLSLLWNLRTNMMFAAYLNELFIKHKQRTYSYGKKPVDLVLYSRLMEIVTFHPSVMEMAKK